MALIMEHGDPGNGGWLKNVLMWDWHELALKGWPGWERDRGTQEPIRVEMSFVVGNGKSSHEIASEFDDVAKGRFYWRDYTESGLPFIDQGDRYRSSFWFEKREDMEMFSRTYMGAAQ